eukprot:SAG31_NODE_178_length_21247_cov_11.492009_16_plen_130_part_00
MLSQVDASAAPDSGSPGASPSGDQPADTEAASSSQEAGSEGEEALVTDPAATREDIDAWLHDSSTTIEDIDGMFTWLSLRRSGNRATKVRKLLGVFDLLPNLFRLALQCYFDGDESHPDRGLLDNVRNQ